MKINQIIAEQEVSEGPIWQGIKGAVSGAKAGYQQGKGQQAAKDAAAVAIKKWNAIAGQLTQAGTPPTLQQFANFIKQAAPTATLPPPTEADMAPTGSAAYITKAASQHIANSALGQPAAPADATAAEPAATPAPVAEPAAPVAAPAATPATTTNGKTFNASNIANTIKPAKPLPTDITVGGNKLDPKNPADLAILQKIIKQQTVASTTPSATVQPTQPSPKSVTYNVPTGVPMQSTGTPAKATPAVAPAATPAPVKDEMGRIEPAMNEGKKVDIAEALWRKMKRIK